MERCNMKHVWIAYMYVYICNNLVYIIHLCYAPINVKPQGGEAGYRRGI